MTATITRLPVQFQAPPAAFSLHQRVITPAGIGHVDGKHFRMGRNGNPGSWIYHVQLEGGATIRTLEGNLSPAGAPEVLDLGVWASPIPDELEDDGLTFAGGLTLALVSIFMLWLLANLAGIPALLANT